MTKTADVLISSIHGYKEALVVDTHMGRIAVRLGLVEENASYHEVQEALTAFLPWDNLPRGKEERLVGLLWMLAKHTCSSRKPRCGECLLARICDKRTV
ncbi:MAG TPA: hypothetical protein EYP23_03245 [Thermoplasmata archaeon]|nr:hypothetical protein [Thermoplasmata archaeon]